MSADEPSPKNEDAAEPVGGGPQQGGRSEQDHADDRASDAGARRAAGADPLSNDFLNGLLDDERALLADLVEALSDAATTMDGIDEPDARAAVQDRNRAAFEAATALAGRRAAATFRDGVAQALAALDASDASVETAEATSEPRADRRTAVRPDDSSEHDQSGADIASLSASLREQRRKTLLDDVNRLTAAIEASMRSAKE